MGHLSNKIIAFYNENEAYFQKIKNRKESEYRIIPEIIRQIGIDKNSSILDIGCGTGNLLSLLEKKSFTNLTGVEPSLKFYNYAKKKLSKSNLINKSFMQWDNDKRFDLIILTDVLEHSDEARVIMQKAHMILSQEGSIIIQGPNMMSFFNNPKRFQNISKLFVKQIKFAFKQDSKFILQKPVLNEKTHMCDDIDACYRINPIDIMSLFRKFNIQVSYMSTYFNPMGKYGLLKKYIVLFFEKIPFIKYLGGTFVIVGSKKKISNLKQFY